MNALIIGGSGGIGSAIVQRLAVRHDVGQIVATYRQRQPEFRHPSLRWVQTDVTCEQEVRELAGQLPKIDLCLNAVGVLHSGDRGPEKTVRNLDAGFFLKNIEVNALPTLYLAKHLAGNLRSSPQSVFATLSARLGSIDENQVGGWYSYRSSKAALNMVLKTLAIEWRIKVPQCCVASLHPGTTDTALSQPFQANVPPEKLFSAKRCARQLLDVIGLLSPDKSGRFWSWDGTELPW